MEEIKEKIKKIRSALKEKEKKQKILESKIKDVIAGLYWKEKSIRKIIETIYIKKNSLVVEVKSKSAANLLFFKKEELRKLLEKDGIKKIIIQKN